MMPRLRLCLTAIVCAISVSCGTALYHHAISIVPADPQAQLTVAVFDHQMGYSHDWAHQAAGHRGGVASVSRNRRHYGRGHAGVEREGAAIGHRARDP